MMTASLGEELKLLLTELRCHGLTPEEILVESERRMLIADLERFGGNVCEVARAWGVHRNTMERRLMKAGINTWAYRKHLPPEGDRRYKPNSVNQYDKKAVS